MSELTNEDEVVEVKPKQRRKRKAKIEAGKQLTFAEVKALQKKAKRPLIVSSNKKRKQ